MRQVRSDIYKAWIIIFVHVCCIRVFTTALNNLFPTRIHYFYTPSNPNYLFA
jgi:hypothetical protein